MNSNYKYNISINVVPVIEHNLDLDYIDLIIFDFIKDFSNSNNCTKIQTNDGLYFWISHTSIMNQLPLLKITSKAGIIKRIDNLINAGILEKSSQSQEFGKSLYRFGKNYDKMIFSDCKPKKSGTNKSLEGYQQKLGGGANESLEDNNNNLYNSDNYNKDINKEKENLRHSEFFKKLTNYFSQNTEPLEMKVFSFLVARINNGEFEEFQKQTLAYMEYKSLSKETVHGWSGYSAEWKQVNWIDKLSKIKTKPKTTIKRALI